MRLLGRLFRLVWGGDVDRALRPVLAVTLCGSIAGATAYPFMGIWAIKHLHAPQGELAFTYLVGAVLAGGIGYGGGHLSDHVGRRPMILAGWGLEALVPLLLLAVGTNLYWGLALLSLLPVFGSLGGAADQAMVADLVPPERHEAAYAAVRVANNLGIGLELGQPLAAADRERMVGRMVRLIMRMIDRRRPDDLTRALLVTEAWQDRLVNTGLDALTFSGGVAEFLYKRETRSFGDLGGDLAHALGHALALRRDLPPVWDPGAGIRATVIGAAQFSVQVSGNTIAISRPEDLPLQNLPVIACAFELAEEIDPAAVSADVREALRRADAVEGESAVALAFSWRGDPSHARLSALAGGICAALPRTLAAALPLMLLIEGDIAMSLGRLIRHETAPGANVIAIDGVALKAFDYVDIGRRIEVTNAVPIIIKSLLFR